MAQELKKRSPQISVVLTPDLLEPLERLAAEHGHNRGALVRCWVKERLELELELPGHSWNHLHQGERKNRPKSEPVSR